MPKLKNKIIKSELVNWYSIKDLQPNNLKDPRNLNYLKESLIKNGFSKAFDVWQSPEGEIYFVDGHTRSDVLKKLVSDGYEIPEKLMCNFVDCKNRKEAVKILLEVHNQKQNKINDQVMNDWVKVEGVDIAEVSVESLNISEVFEDDEVEEELEAEEDDFEVKDTDQIKTDIVLGDLFEIGDHRLLCGDSTDSDQVARLMGGEKADMVFTDPPYGIDYSGGRTEVAETKTYGKLINDDLQGSELGELISNVFLFNEQEADVYICVSPKMQKPFLDFVENSNKVIDAVIVWDKKQPGLGYMTYRRQCEFILFIKGGVFKKGDTSDLDLWSISRDNGQNYVHGTQKPIAVPSRAINNSSKKDDLVLDYFLGSGSTMVASHQLKRKCYGMELDPKYCQVIINRMKKLDPDLVIKKNGTVI